jgi:hypothetical protein
LFWHLLANYFPRDARDFFLEKEETLFIIIDTENIDDDIMKGIIAYKKAIIENDPTIVQYDELDSVGRFCFSELIRRGKKDLRVKYSKEKL